MDDLRAVLDAASVDRAALFGMSEGGPMSLLFAAAHPDRVQSLVMYGVSARFSQELPDYPWGFTAEEKANHLADIESHWGQGVLGELFFGEFAETPGFAEFYGRAQRLSASPTMAAWLWQALLEIDVRGILGSVRAPTIVLARPDDRVAPFEGAKALAAAIPGAHFKALPKGPHSVLDAVLGSAILEFVCGTPSTVADERVVKSVLFTDIVSSTELLSAGGDAAWRRQLDAHDKAVDWLVEKYGGSRAKHTGDGVFALFDGPTKAARCALELVPALATRGIRIRAGVHTGECERRHDEWSGIAVHTGARIGAAASAGEVLASRTVRDLSAGSDLDFHSLGSKRLKGLPEDTEVFRVTTRRSGERPSPET
jgi:class 3 adenylate cyclase